MLGLGLSREDLLHDGRRGRSGQGGPGNDALRRPFGIFPMGPGHVFRQSAVLARKKRTGMGSNPIPFIQAFDGRRGGADIQLLSDQAMGDIL